jgi:adenosylmethionine-8-amino-7-oxononanoate aminotransferase
MTVDNQVASVARRMGLFVRPLGGTIILGPPLIFTKAQAERTVDVLDTALSEVGARVPAEVGR